MVLYEATDSWDFVLYYKFPFYQLDVRKEQRLIDVLHSSFKIPDLFHFDKIFPQASVSLAIRKDDNIKLYKWFLPELKFYVLLFRYKQNYFNTLSLWTKESHLVLLVHIFHVHIPYFNMGLEGLRVY